MKNKIISCSFAGFALLFSACSSEILNEPMSDNMQSGEQTQTRLSFEQALERGEQVYDNLFKDEMRTRGSKRQVESVECILGSTRTRGANEGDTLFYVVNYADMGGFLMVPTDSRLEPVYAMSDQGRLDFSDTVQNKGLKAFYSNAVESASSTLANLPSVVPGDPIVGSVDPYDPEPTPLKVDPLLSDYQQKIGQGNPYNAYTKEYLGGVHAKVGCPAIAMQQIMSYYKYPYRPNGVVIDWDKVNSGNDDRNLAVILARIGVTIHTSYGINESGVEDPIQMVNGFRDMYDYDPGTEVKLTSQLAAYQLTKGPALVYTKKLDVNMNGHVWVIDGYKRTSGASYLGATYYFHCVWGWYGQSNGYYLWNLKKFSRYPDGDIEFEPQYPVYMLRGLKPNYNFEI